MNLLDSAKVDSEIAEGIFKNCQLIFEEEIGERTLKRNNKYFPRIFSNIFLKRLLAPINCWTDLQRNYPSYLKTNCRNNLQYCKSTLFRFAKNYQNFLKILPMETYKEKYQSSKEFPKKNANKLPKKIYI